MCHVSVEAATAHFREETCILVSFFADRCSRAEIALSGYCPHPNSLAGQNQVRPTTLYSARRLLPILVLCDQYVTRRNFRIWDDPGHNFHCFPGRQAVDLVVGMCWARCIIWKSQLPVQVYHAWSLSALHSFLVSGPCFLEVSCKHKDLRSSHHLAWATISA